VTDLAPEVETSFSATAVAEAALSAPPWLQAVLLLGVWIGTGVGAAVLLGRRGHDLRSVVGLGAALGPLFVPLALDHVRHRDPGTSPQALGGSALQRGPRTVVLLTGPAEQVADALPVLERLHDVGQLTLATPVGYSTLRAPSDDPTRRAAETLLLDASVLLFEHDPTLVLAPGTLFDAVDRLVETDQDIVLIVGEAGQQLRSRVAASSRVPVVVVPSGGTA
jgi:hypothetical protein